MDVARQAHIRLLVEQLHKLEDRLREGGGPVRIEKQHGAGKMTARERIAALLDAPADFLEIGLLIAYDRYDGQAPAAGVVTGLGKIEGRTAVIVANDATVKAGAWWPETITKILRAQEIAMRNRLPIVYLVDSAGVNLPYQDGIFPGQYGAGRIFYYNSLMRRKLRIPQTAAVMGPCIAGGAYLPALSDVIIMVEGVSFMGLGGPNLVKGATGQTIDSEPLGGARMHTAVSGVAHYMARDDADALALHPAAVPHAGAAAARGGGRGSADGWRGFVRRAARRPPAAVRNGAGDLPHLRRRRLCGIPAGARARNAVRECAAGGRPVAIIANRRGFLKSQDGRGSAASCIRNRRARWRTSWRRPSGCGIPLIYLQDVSGFMVGPEAEREGIIRAGAEMVETMACATVPKIVLTLNHASGAGYYAMAGQGFDPNFTFNWPTARIGVMEGDSAVVALFAAELEKYKGQALPEELQKSIDKTRADYERWLDAKYAAARGHADAIIDPLESRKVLRIALEACLENPAGGINTTGVTL